MPHRADVQQLPPLVRLPRDEMVIRPHSHTHLAVGLYTRLGALHLQKVPLLDLPNDLIGIEDLERAGVLPIYVAAVDKLQNGSAAVTSGVAAGVGERRNLRPEDDRVGLTAVSYRRKALDLFHRIFPTRFFRAAA